MNADAPPPPRPATVALALLAWLPTPLALVAMTLITARSHAAGWRGSSSTGVPIVFGVATAVAAAVGGLLAVRRPRHPVGWLLVGLGASIALAGAVDSYAEYAVLARPGTWPGGDVAAAIGAATWVPWLVIVALVLHLTPTGRPLSRLWSRVAWATVLAGGLTFVAILLSDEPLEAPLQGVRNPMAVHSAAVGATRAIAGSAVGLGLVAAAISLVVRFRRSTGVARRQLLWLALVVVPLPLFVLGAFLGSASDHPLVVIVATGGLIVLIPVAVGLSIVKYHLYEVDRLLSRATVYALLTTALVSAYAVLIVGLSRVIGARAGDTPFAAVGATLLTVSIAAPARRRLQDAVDRRFNRRRFDALRLVRVALQESEPVLDVEQILRDALHDPTLALAYWVDEREQWVDGGGQPVSAEPTALVVKRGARDVARVRFDHDAVERQLAETVLTELVTELDNVGLRAAVALQLVEVQQSRARIATAQLDERRSLERNLHDGAQQRLLALAMQLRAAGVAGDDSRLHAAAAAAVEQLQAAVAELRELANGLNPAVLNDGGLAAALDDLAMRTPVPVHIDASDDRYAPQVEATAWFIACESVANAVKHAAPANITVDVRREQRHLVVSVHDDGVGGADPRGHGLRGLADRAEAAGGRLVVTSSPGAGTTVEALLPCG
ncbi:MAG: histidine kinase [Mycobacteriales bacterium]